MTVHSRSSSGWYLVSYIVRTYIHHLLAQVLHCDLLQYADDSTLVKVMPSKDNRTAAADELGQDLLVGLDVEY